MRINVGDRKKVRTRKTAVRESMNDEYGSLIVRYGVMDEGWKHVVECDLRQASILIAKPMKDLYDALERNKGFFRTILFEVERRPLS